MIKTQRQRRARQVRVHLGAFINCQDSGVRSLITADGNDPDKMALSHLLAAQSKLDALVADLLREGYGSDQG